METVGILGVLILGVLALAVAELRTRQRAQQATVNYLIPGKDDEPLTPRETFVAGVNHVGLCGEHRQNVIAGLRKKEAIYLVRQADNPHDLNAVILYSAKGKDIGFLPRETAMEIAPRLDKGSPVTATVLTVERFETEEGRSLLGVRLRIVPHKLRRGMVHPAKSGPPPS
jgi:hypothetical protein